MSAAEQKELLIKFNRNPAATADSLRLFERSSRLRLPTMYLDFLKRSNGGEGFIGKAYAILWRIEELLEMNKAYRTEEYAPGLLLFGSDGGGEAFAFDMKSDATPIVSVPFVGMALDAARPIAVTFEGFLDAVSKS